ncbi:MAG: IS91 family transposase [Lysobacter sp.]|nr:IS91 family transposase [Lysobacter sp.]
MMPPLQRPALELAEVIARHGHRLGDDLSGEQRRILRAIRSCRTGSLGGHVQTCDSCQHRRIAYNSCRNRHCPRCQGSACARWMADREEELLPVEYFHVVFTLPDVFNALALGNRRVVYGVLFDAVAQTLLEVAANPKRLGARIGFLAILHTWGQNLSMHPHVHCVVPGGGLSPDGKWVPCRPGFFLPVRVLSRVFRGKFIALLKQARRKGKLIGTDDDRAFDRLLDASVKHDWVVYAKRPFGGPAQVLKYLARYTHRIAISNRRLLSIDEKSVTFGFKDYARGNRSRAMTLDGKEFLRRFLMHAIPRGFMRIRHFGLLANRVRTKNLAICRRRLAASLPSVTGAAQPPGCPACGRGRLIAGPRLSPMELARLTLRLDSS